jgi:hypothetical protein
MTLIVELMAAAAARRGSGRRMPMLAAAVAVRLKSTGQRPVAVARSPVHVI